MESFNNAQYVLQGGASSGPDVQEVTPVSVYQSPLMSLGAQNIQHMPAVPPGSATLESTLGSVVPKLKTITVVHHKKVTPSSGLPISPQSERPQGPGQRKVISLLVSPIDSAAKTNDASKTDQGSQGADNKNPEPGFPRPVNLVRRLGNSQVMPAALSEAMNRVPVSRTTTVTQGQTEAVAGRSLLSGQNKGIAGNPKTVRVVKVNPVLSPVKKGGTTPSLSAMPQNFSANPEYNRTLLEYVNKTLAKSGHVTMIQDGNQLREEIQHAGDKLVVIDFFSMGSSVCQRIAPQVQQLSLEYEDVVFLKVDIEHTQDTSLMYNIQSTPTFVLLRGGINLYQLQSPDVIELEERIKAFRNQPLAPKVLFVKGAEKTTPKNQKEADCNYLDKSGRLVNKNWELDPTTGEMKETEASAKEGKRGAEPVSDSNDFVKQVLKDWLVPNSDDATTGSLANNIPKKVTLPFLIEDDDVPLTPQKDSENDIVDVEHDNMASLATNISQSASIFRNQKTLGKILPVTVSEKPEPRKKKSVRKQKLVTREEMDLETMLTTSNSDERPVVPYSTQSIVSQEEPRDIEIAVPVTMTTPTSSPFKGNKPPVLSSLFKSPGGFWNSIRQDVDSDDDGAIDYGEDYDDTGGFAEDFTETATTSPTKFDDLHQGPSKKQPITNSANKDGHRSWLNKPNISTLNPASVKTVNTNKAMVTKQVFETGEDTFMKEKPESNTQYYFSISSRPRPSSRGEIATESVLSLSTKPSVTTSAKSLKASKSRKSSQTSKSSQNAKPLPSTKSSKNIKSVLNDKKRSHKRINSSPLPSQSSPAKHAKAATVKETASPGSTQSDDNSDGCFVILSRDPKIEELLSAKKKPLASKKRRADSTTARNLGKEETTEDSDSAIDDDEWDTGSAAEDEANTSQSPSDSGPQSCRMCSKVLANRYTLRRHIRDVHGKNPYNPAFGAVSPFAQDVTTSTKPEVYPCRHCNRNFPTALGLSRHKTTEHNIINKSAEPEVVPTPAPAKEPKKHLSGSDVWTCVKCDKDFATSKGLLTHNTALHRDDKETKLFAESLNPTECWRCEKRFSCNKNLRRHVRAIHRIKDGVLPPKPVKAAKSQSQANIKQPNVHLKQPNVKQPFKRSNRSESESTGMPMKKAYQCPACKLIYTDRSSCYRHIRRLHRKKLGILVVRQKIDKISTYCWKCDKNFSDRKCLRNHVIIIHKIRTGKLPPKSSQTDDKAQTPSPDEMSGHKCMKCLRVYSSSKSLRKHIRQIHEKKSTPLAKTSPTKSTPLAKTSPTKPTNKPSRCLATCANCGVTYSNPANLKRHQLTHYGEILTPMTRPMQNSPVVKSPVVKIALLKSSMLKNTPVKTSTSKISAVRTPPVSAEKTKIKKPLKTIPKADEPCYTCKCGEKFTNFAHMMKHIAVDHKRKTAEKMADMASEASSEGEEETVETEENIEEDEKTGNTADGETEEEGGTDMVACLQCGRRYANRANLRRHQRVIHKMKSDLERMGVSGTKCCKCEREFESEANMKKHFVLAHLRKKVIKTSGSDTRGKINSRKPYCTKCGKWFAHFHSLKRHAAVFHQLTLSRSLGHKKLSSSSGQKKSSPELPRCSVCGKMFTKHVNLQRHFAIAHKNHKMVPGSFQTEAPDTEPAKKDSPENVAFRCFKCNSHYSSLGNLTRHIKVVHKLDPKEAPVQRKMMMMSASQKGEKEDCRHCVKFILRIREVRRHLHTTHGVRLAGWDSQDLKGQMVHLRTIMWKQLQTTFGPKTCAVCLQSRLLLRAVNRHCSMPHSENVKIPKMRYVNQGKMMGAAVKSPSSALPAVKTPSSAKLKSSGKTFSSSKSKFHTLKGSKLFVKIRPIDKPKSLHGSSTSGTNFASPSTSTMSSPGLHRCSVCGKAFTQGINLQRHFTVAHKNKLVAGKSTKETAAPEPEQSKSPGTVNLTVTKQLEYTCPICEQSFWLPDSLLRHQYTHLPEKSRICKKCGVGFRSCQALSVHYAEGCQSVSQEEGTEDGNRYKCQVCKDTFSLLDTLVRHNKNQHRNAVHSCKYCPAMFRTLSYLRYHIKRKHLRESGENQNSNQGSETVVHPIGEAVANKAILIKTECQDEMSEAGAAVAEPAKLIGDGLLSPSAIKTEPADEFSTEAATRGDGEAPGSSDLGDPDAASQSVRSFIQIEDGRYQCKNCGSLFQNLKSLVQHQKIQHSLIRHQCPKCPAGFKTRVYLNYHCKRQHGITDPETQRPVAKVGPAKPSASKKLKKRVDTETEPFLRSASPCEDSDHRYTCPFCAVGFRTMFYLRYHLNTLHGIHDLDDQEYAAVPRKNHKHMGGFLKSKGEGGGIRKSLSSVPGQKKSPVSFKSLKNLKFMKSNLGAGDYKCEICGSLFQQMKTLNEHKKKQHEETTCKCHVCKAPFKTESYLVYHLKLQHGIEADENQTPSKIEPSRTCDVCGATFSHYKSVKPHKIAQHRKINHHCKECNAGFTTCLYLTIHMKNQHGIVHQEELPVETSESGAEKKHVCTICKASFQTLYSVKQHIQQQHEDPNCQYTCSQCDAGFVSHSYYRHHMKSQHDITIEVEKSKPDTPEPGPDGRYVCQVCAASFAHHKNLVQHSNQQHKNIRIRCTLCKAGFRRRCFLDHHLKKQHNITDIQNKQYFLNLSSAKLSVHENTASPSESLKQCGDEVDALSEGQVDTTIDTTLDTTAETSAMDVDEETNEGELPCRPDANEESLASGDTSCEKSVDNVVSQPDANPGGSADNVEAHSNPDDDVELLSHGEVQEEWKSEAGDKELESGEVVNEGDESDVEHNEGNTEGIDETEPTVEPIEDWTEEIDEEHKEDAGVERSEEQEEDVGVEVEDTAELEQNEKDDVAAELNDVLQRSEELNEKLEASEELYEELEESEELNEELERSEKLNEELEASEELINEKLEESEGPNEELEASEELNEKLEASEELNEKLEESEELNAELEASEELDNSAAHQEHTEDMDEDGPCNQPMTEHQAEEDELATNFEVVHEPVPEVQTISDDSVDDETSSELQIELERKEAASHASEVNMDTASGVSSVNEAATIQEQQ